MTSNKKICTKCKENKFLEDFCKRSRNKDGLSYICRDCTRLRRKSVPYLVSKIYGTQKRKSIIRGHPKPSYTKKEFEKWIKSQKNFDILYDEWVKSDYDVELTPSVDRINDYDGYYFSNIRLVTWSENNKKAKDDRKSGRNNKVSTPVLQFSLDGKFVAEHHSVRSAARFVGGSSRNISAACKGEYKTSKGYIWKYKKSS